MTEEQIAATLSLAESLQEVLDGQNAVTAAAAVGVVIGQLVKIDALLDDFLDIVAANATASMLVSGDSTIH